MAGTGRGRNAGLAGLVAAAACAAVVVLAADIERLPSYQPQQSHQSQPSQLEATATTLPATASTQALATPAAATTSASSVGTTSQPPHHVDVWQNITITDELQIKSPQRPDWTIKSERALGWRQAGCQWSYYSNTQPADCLAKELDRDHLMPQAEYLRSGGVPANYRDFYLDTANIFILPSEENRAKSDYVYRDGSDGSDGWQPRDGTACQYATDWLGTKRR